MNDWGRKYYFFGWSISVVSKSSDWETWQVNPQSQVNVVQQVHLG